MDKQSVTYILATERNGTSYVGVTSNLIARIWQHREHVVDGFTKKHGVKKLVWYELHETMESAITREKRLRKWNRAWKVRLIETFNPYWNDLWPNVIGPSQVTGFPPARE
ncbi:GIY-YIG nuclease family protein [Pseudoxanthomonas wuyuanensis]